LKYTYHDQLQFLERLQVRNTDSNFDTSSEDTHLEEASATEKDEDDAQMERHLHTEGPSCSETGPPTKMARKGTDFERNLLQLLEDSKEKEDDDDRAFLTSLLPALKTLNIDQKLQFQAEVLNVMMRIKNSNQALSLQIPSCSRNPVMPYEIQCMTYSQPMNVPFNQQTQDIPSQQHTHSSLYHQTNPSNVVTQRSSISPYDSVSSVISWDSTSGASNLGEH
jgi:hypothetical protein